MADTAPDVGTALGAHAEKHGKKYFGVSVACLAVIVILIIVVIVLAMGGDSFKSKFSNNLQNGSNNPLWWHGMGDAGWGGSMHSTYQGGESRVQGASAMGGHDLQTKAYPRQGCGGKNPAAMAEAYALKAAGAYGGSAKNMSDDQLMKVMSGGSAV